MTKETTPALSTLVCVECGERFDVRAIRYSCDCGGLLDVELNIPTLKTVLGNGRTRFDGRLTQRGFTGGSGVWRYHELVLPGLPLDEVVSLGEGNTGLYLVDELGVRLGVGRLWLKHEGENPTLSFKDRGMTAGVSWGRHLGATVGICASTGDTSASMAAYTARATGMSGVVLLPAGKVTDEQLAQAMVYGARTLALDTDFDGCMRVVQELARSPSVYLLNSKNPFRVEGQKTIGLEVCQELWWRSPDWFVVPVGNAGNIAALGKGLREAQEIGLIEEMPKIAGVQIAAADPFYQSFERGFASRVSVTAKPTTASAIRIGDPVSYPRARRVIEETGGYVLRVSEQEALDAQAQIGRCGIQACPNSAVAMAGLERLVAEGLVTKEHEVVVILTAHGAKFSSTSLAYHRGEVDGFDPQWANPPVPLPASAEAVAEALGIEQ